MHPDSIAQIWEQVAEWTPDERLEFAARILESLGDGAVKPSSARAQALPRVIGIWKTEAPPDDDAVEQIIQKERLGKYG